MATYTLPTFATKLGTFTVIVDSTVTGLDTPTENTVVDLRGGREVLEILPGGISFSPSTITVLDTADEFWAQVCAGTTLVLVLLNEGAGNTFAFGGDIVPKAARATETYNDGTTKHRQFTIQLKSPLERLKDIDISAIDNGVETSGAEVKAVSDNDWYLPVMSLFAIAIESAFSASYDATDAYVQAGTGTVDIIYNDLVNDLGLADLYFQTKEEDAYIGYLDTTNDDYWPNTYGTVWEFVQALAMNFGVLMRYDYNPSTGRHRMQLLQRGRAFDSAVSLGAPYKSTVNYESFMKIKYAQATIMVSAVQKGYWYALGSYSLAPVPDWLESDINIPMIFVCGNSAPDYDTATWQRLWSMETGDPSDIYTVKIWNYTTGAQVSFTVLNTGDAKLEKALITYLINRYRGTGQTTYSRSYPEFRASGGSHTAVNPMCAVTIDSVDHTAIEVDKDFTTGEAHLTLVKL